MGLIVLTGTGIRDTRELAPSATMALRRVRDHMKLRRPAARIEDERWNPVSFFQLKEMAELEGRKEESLAHLRARRSHATSPSPPSLRG
jgi:hypothetical protein